MAGQNGIFADGITDKVCESYDACNVLGNAICHDGACVCLEYLNFFELSTDSYVAGDGNTYDTACSFRSNCEIFEDTIPCGLHSHCKELEEVASCACTEGFEDDNSDGDDVSDNQCKRSDPCESYDCLADNSVCIVQNDEAVCACDNSYQLYQFQSNLEYELGANFNTTTFDGSDSSYRCAEQFPCVTADCLEDENKVCVADNYKGITSAYCACKTGYKAVEDVNDNRVIAGDTDTMTCVDYDECDLGVHSCDQSHGCINTAGSYICECPEGYEQNIEPTTAGTVECTICDGECRFDECKIGTHQCDHTQLLLQNDAYFKVQCFFCRSSMIVVLNT